MATKIAQKIYFSKFLSKLFRPYRSKSFRVFPTMPGITVVLAKWMFG